MGLEEYVYENVIKPILKTTNDGKYYIDEDEFVKLDLTQNELSFAKMVLENKNIDVVKKTIVEEVVEENKEFTITEKDRSPKVENTTYGEIQTFELEDKDIPKKSEIEYKEGQLVFKNFEELDEFLETEFIPNKIKYKVVRNKQSTEKPYPSIQYNEIVKLRLSEEEVKHVMEYLENEGIRVGGISPQLDSEFDNYDYTRTHKTIDNLPTKLDPAKQEQLFREYKTTQDLTRKNEIRQELIMGNLRLAKYLSFKASRYYEKTIEELESYAVEGLIYAVENYDVDKDAKFSSYACPCINGYIKRAMSKESILPDHLYYDFASAKRAVEKEFDRPFVPGDIEMYKEILDLLEYSGKISYELKKHLLKGVMNVQSLDEQLEEKDIAYDPKVENEAMHNVISENIQELLDTLTEKERLVINMRFGLDGKPPMGLEEVGRYFNVTRERIRQIEAKALRKLRDPSRSRKLKGAFDDNGLNFYDNDNHYVIGNVANVVDKDESLAR